MLGVDQHIIHLRIRTRSFWDMLAHEAAADSQGLYTSAMSLIVACQLHAVTLTSYTATTQRTSKRIQTNTWCTHRTS